jgi:electron transfer flavoprotein beta subunit
VLKKIVPVKRVIDFTVKIKVRPEAAAVDKKTAKMSMNPFCEIAMEEATRLKEKQVVSEIVAVSIGPKQSQDVLRTALAIGADKGIHILTDLRADLDLQPLAVAKILQKIVSKVSPDLVILGKQAIDGDNNQTGQLLAGLLNWPQLTFASKVEVDGDKKGLQVTREVDGGLQTLKARLQQ